MALSHESTSIHPSPGTLTARERAAAGSRDTLRVASRSVLVAATVLMGLIAGFFYAYACSVMIGLKQADDRTFIVAMQEINASVRNVWFAPSFFGALIVTGVAVLLAGRQRDRVLLVWTLAGLVFYAAAFVMTLAISVPLNNDLAAAGPPDTIANLAAIRAAYEDPWVRWNIARTGASTLALLCLIRALVIHDRPRLSAGRRRR